MASHHNRKLNTFAISTFRDVADQDYINARLAYRAELYPQFLWCAQQTFEKYLKCLLFLQRVPARKIFHDLGAALLLVKQRLPFVVLDASTVEMIEYIDAYGRYRYFESPWFLEGHVLPKFDLAVWQLRRYCQPIDPEAHPDGNCPELMDSIRRSTREPFHKFRIDGGRLEAVSANKKHPARRALLWQNLMFGTRRRRSIRSVRKFNAGMPPLMNFPEILEDVDRLAHVPGEVKEACASVWGPEKAKRIARAQAPGAADEMAAALSNTNKVEGDSDAA